MKPKSLHVLWAPEANKPNYHPQKLCVGRSPSTGNAQPAAASGQTHSSNGARPTTEPCMRTDSLEVTCTHHPSPKQDCVKMVSQGSSLPLCAMSEREGRDSARCRTAKTKGIVVTPCIGRDLHLSTKDGGLMNEGYRVLTQEGQ